MISMSDKSLMEKQSKTAITRLLIRILEEFKMVWNLSPKLGGNARRQIKDKINEINQLVIYDSAANSTPEKKVKKEIEAK